MQTSTDPFGLVGATIADRYAVEALVAEGGFSVVYRARHVLWNRPVAIKAFRGFESLDGDARGRLLRAFVQEGAILAELSERSTAIVQARDTATLVTEAGDWVPYLVLEWLPGETLEAVLWKERQAGLRPRRLDEAMALLEPVAQALALAHDKGICHRDLKPGNVVLLGDPRGASAVVKLLDFGTASFFSDAHRALAGRSPEGVGPANERRGDDPSPPCGFTPSYGAPEQFSTAHGVTGPWTDVFALALMLVELVTGHEPMGEGRSLSEYAQTATDPSWRPTPRAIGADAAAAVERVFERGLAVFPAERWHTVGTFWQALRDAAREGAEVAPEADPSGARATTAPSPAEPSPRLPRVAPALAVALALALAASTASDHRTGRAPGAVAANAVCAAR